MRLQRRTRAVRVLRCAPQAVELFLLHMQRLLCRFGLALCNFRARRLQGPYSSGKELAG